MTQSKPTPAALEGLADMSSACNRNAPGYQNYVRRLRTERDPFADPADLITRLEEKAAFLNADCDCGTCQQCSDGLLLCEAANALSLRARAVSEDGAHD